MLAAFGDQRLDANLTAILALAEDGAPFQGAQPAITLKRGLRVPRQVSVAIVAMIGVTLFTGTALIIGREGAEMEGDDRYTSSPKFAVKNAMPAPMALTSKVSIPLPEIDTSIVASAKPLTYVATVSPIPTHIAPVSRSSRKVFVARTLSPRAYAKIHRATLTKDLLYLAPVTPAPAASPLIKPDIQFVAKSTPPTHSTMTLQTQAALPSPEARRDTVDAIRDLRRQW